MNRVKNTKNLVIDLSAVTVSTEPYLSLIIPFMEWPKYMSYLNWKIMAWCVYISTNINYRLVYFVVKKTENKFVI